MRQKDSETERRRGRKTTKKKATAREIESDRERERERERERGAPPLTDPHTAALRGFCAHRSYAGVFFCFFPLE